MASLRSPPLAAIRDVPLASVRAFLEGHGYLFRERWGSYLQRFSKKQGGREDNVLVPTERDIVDFDKRMIEIIETLSRQLKTSAPVLLKQVVNAGYEVVRIRANEGEDQSTLAYDAAIDLLRGGYALIDSSAVVAVSDERLRVVRGRRPDIVRKYLDGVRVGQTEVGSFVMTLLMPISTDANALELPQEVADGFGARVAQKMSTALTATEAAVRSGELAIGGLTDQGVTANFSAGLAQILEAVGDITLSVSPATTAGKRTRLTAGKFHFADVPRLRQIEHRLTPSEQRRSLTITGTVTNISEPRGKASGSVTVKTDVYGEERPVRIKYNRADRPTIIEAMQLKSEMLLCVEGMLTSRGGHYRLEEPKHFRTVPRGYLA